MLHRTFPITTSWIPPQLEFDPRFQRSAFGISANHADAVNARNFIARRGLKPHCYPFPSLNESGGQRVFHVEEVYALLRASALCLLFSNPGAIHQNRERAATSHVATVGDDESHRMRRFHR